ncbi:quinone-dependent dihydroorotate dehydrogenase [Oscillatoria amoena NRMC-F 0135]|nr:quinone-dependent dihydroorotate dehydrogenase [Oscillatoria amoena NRMC-F 0135]
MRVYSNVIRPVLFLFDAERIHHFVFKLLRLKSRFPGFKRLVSALFRFESPSLERTVFGIRFKNPVGLAAGFDKDAKLIDELACFGFGFIEIGTLTPHPQAGNEKPRLFRLPHDRALINRLGFNNEGVLAAVERLKKRKSDVIIGGNIGKNKSTPNERALDDYAYCVEALHPYVDYFVVNVSSPNTPGLRELQEKEPLRKLLSYIKGLVGAKEKSKPVLLKIAPDLTVEQLDDVIEILKDTKTDGVIATNTTILREHLVISKEEVNRIGAGGLSGEPLREQSNAVIKYLRKHLGPGYPIIGVGGIMSADDALEKLKAGADLVQIYTGFVYEGPGFVKRINKAIQAQRESL